MTFRVLPNSGRPTTSLGFGCAYVVSGFEQSKSTRLIHAAFDTGLRHFDVAPSYGMGTAEDALGTALTGRRAKVTIASKAGIARPNVSSAVMLARTLASPLRKHLSRFTRSVGQNLVKSARGQFGVNAVEQSLSETLRCLKTDYLDLFLLHEVQLDDLSDELLSFMENVRHKGIAQSIGVASERIACEAIALAYRDFFDVFQYSWNVLDSKELSIPGATFVITHRAILNALQPASNWLRSDRNARLRLSSATGFDLGSEEVLADLLLAAALARNHTGIVLAASRNVERVKHFGDVMRNQSMHRAGAKLIEALLREDGRPQPEGGMHKHFVAIGPKVGN